MMDFKRIYATQATEYARLVAREDWQGNLLSALAEILPALNAPKRPLTNLNVVELGAGTGRITRLLAPRARQITALDISPHMLGAAQDNLDLAGLGKPARSVHLAAADNRHLPIAAQTADLALAGWSLGHFVGWHPQDWREQIGQALAEMKRVLRPGGTLILIETLGTGRETPQPPHNELAAYYRWLEDELGFSTTWIRTDYRFASVDEADILTRFFFGDELADRIRRQQITLLPECTGLWWLAV
ncbi:MAG: class I SAM-dependent methyltransferase [Chloroflexi bacterium]|nr:class I SAM-dependent methyltransferase [Chloroflexota bacterium]